MKKRVLSLYIYNLSNAAKKRQDTQKSAFIGSLPTTNFLVGKLWAEEFSGRKM